MMGRSIPVVEVHRYVAPGTVKAIFMDPHHRLVDVLARAQLFRALDRRVLGELAGRLPQRVVGKGAAIFVQDELGDRMFVLAEGVVKLVLRSPQGDVIELVRHRPPAVFGEVAVLDGGPRSATAEAVQQSRLIVVAREEFLRLLRSDMEVADALLHSLGEMVRRTTRHMSDLVFLDMKGRVARQLLQLAEDGGTSTSPITQSELAEMVGGARQTVNLALRGLERDGHIRVGRRIRILDAEALRRRTYDW
jgi:CRP-like cAMP-binding protein